VLVIIDLSDTIKRQIEVDLFGAYTVENLTLEQINATMAVYLAGILQNTAVTAAHLTGQMSKLHDTYPIDYDWFLQQGWIFPDFGQDLTDPRVYADGGIASGPLSGYPATLHGTEAVIPLKKGSVPVEIKSIPYPRYDRTKEDYDKEYKIVIMLDGKVVKEVAAKEADRVSVLRLRARDLGPRRLL
jgi:hypothetical protein